MMIDFDSTKPMTRYHLMTQTAIPRPIAWILSSNEDLSLNLAPFSYFNAVCSEPPLLAVSVGKKPGGELKDTRQNLLSGRDFVIHIASVSQAEQLNGSAAAFEYGESEVSMLDLNTTNFPGCNVPRLSDCMVAYHCELYDVHELGPERQAVIYAQVKQLYVDDQVIDKKDNRYQINPYKIDPLCRLGGSFYGTVKDVFSLKRP